MEENGSAALGDLIEKMDEEMRVIKDKSALIEDQLRDFQSVELEYVTMDESGKRERETVNVQRIEHISTFLDSVSERIEKELKRAYLKEFDIVVDPKRDLTVHTPMEAEYRENVEEEIEKRLGFSIDEYNRRTVAIEDRVLEMCREIQGWIQEIRVSVHQLHRLELQFNYLASFQRDHDHTGDYDVEFEEVLGKMEKKIQEGMEEKIRKTIRENVAKIHFHFSTIKMLQSKLYHKVVTKYTCNICIQNNVDCYYEKCGHAICRGCGIRNRNSNVCPFCKTEGALKQLFL